MSKNLQYLSISASSLILISLFLFTFISTSSLDITTVFAQISNNSLHEEEDQTILDQLARIHGFLMLGTNSLYLSHLPMYNVPAHSYQTIIEAEIDEPHMEKYLEIKKENPTKPIIISNTERIPLEKLVNSSSFVGRITFANEDGDPIGNRLISPDIPVNIKKILLFKQLNENSPDYPKHLEYYLFGTDSDWHLSHFLSKAPNFEQELDISIAGNLSDKIKESKIIKVSIPSLNEESIQPITNDPLNQNDYIIATENGDKIPISITNKFWINNNPLNP